MAQIYPHKLQATHIVSTSSIENRTQTNKYISLALLVFPLLVFFFHLCPLNVVQTSNVVETWNFFKKYKGFKCKHHSLSKPSSLFLLAFSSTFLLMHSLQPSFCLFICSLFLLFAFLSLWNHLLWHAFKLPNIKQVLRYWYSTCFTLIFTFQLNIPQSLLKLMRHYARLLFQHLVWHMVPQMWVHLLPKFLKNHLKNKRVSTRLNIFSSIITYKCLHFGRLRITGIVASCRQGQMPWKPEIGTISIFMRFLPQFNLY